MLYTSSGRNAALLPLYYTQCVYVKGETELTPKYVAQFYVDTLALRALRTHNNSNNNNNNNDRCSNTEIHSLQSKYYKNLVRCKF